MGGATATGGRSQPISKKKRLIEQQKKRALCASVGALSAVLQMQKYGHVTFTTDYKTHKS